MQKATLSHLNKHIPSLSRILMRADFNVPLKDNQVHDLTRIKSTIPTIRELLKHNPKSLVLLSHHGRPNGKKIPQHSLRPVIEPLQSLLGRPVKFLQDCVGPQVHSQIANSQGQIFLCQNVRFHPEEEGSFKDHDGNKKKVSPTEVNHFREQLSKLGDVFVNDAFGTAHRAHSSVVGIKHKYRVAGRLLEKELQYLGTLKDNRKKKSILSILGGSKVTDKIKLIQNLIDISDQIIIAGGMSYPFIKQLQGLQLGSTQIKMPEDINSLRKIMEKAQQKGVKIHLPVDGVGSKTLSNTGYSVTCPNEDVPEGWALYDIGPKSIQHFHEAVSRADIIFWNGPVGVFELQTFKNGSEQLLNGVIKRTREGAISIMGGGDTSNLVNRFSAQKEVSYISTGGGASLQFIQGIKLPGVEALSEVSQLK